jgi:hypothetical protein
MYRTCTLLVGYGEKVSYYMAKTTKLLIKLNQAGYCCQTVAWFRVMISYL